MSDCIQNLKFKESKMKKSMFIFIISLMCFCFFMAGCTEPTETPVQTEQPSTETDDNGIKIPVLPENVGTSPFSTGTYNVTTYQPAGSQEWQFNAEYKTLYRGDDFTGPLGKYKYSVNANENKIYMIMDKIVLNLDENSNDSDEGFYYDFETAYSVYQKYLLNMGDTTEEAISTTEFFIVRNFEYLWCYTYELNGQNLKLYSAE